MADDYTSVLALIQRVVIEPAESTHLKELIREGLWEFRNKHFAFSDAKSTFATVADQVEYEPGQDDVPGDIFRILHLRTLTGTSYVEVTPATLEEFRSLQTSSSASGSRAQRYLWFDGQIELWPTPSSAITVAVDYQRDSTRDELTGEEFTEESDGAFTNPFFKEGRDLLTAYVLTRWGLGRGRDAELATQQGSVYQLALKRLSLEYTKQKWGDGCARSYL